jgi:CTP:molybdopterin cytidylyltransferase MocA
MVVNPDPDRGMFSSIQLGLAAVDRHVSRVLVLPADMPFVRPETVSLIASAVEGATMPLVPAYHGRSGHPLSIPADLLPDVLRCDMRKDLKTALLEMDRLPVRIAVDDPGVLRDIDTKADLGG